MAKKRTTNARTKTRTKTKTRKDVSAFSRQKEKGKRLTSAQKLSLHLNEALAIENAAIQRLQSRIKQTKMESIRQRLTAHLEETKKQQDRLKQLISDPSNGQKSTATKDKAQLPIPTPPRSLTKMFGRMMTSAESELTAAKEDAMVENAEIILYDMLTHLAERMNAAHAIATLSESLSEERAMADWIRTYTPDMVAELWPEIEASIALDEGE